MVGGSAGEPFIVVSKRRGSAGDGSADDSFDEIGDGRSLANGRLRNESVPALCVAANASISSSAGGRRDGSLWPILRRSGSTFDGVSAIANGRRGSKLAPSKSS